MTLWGEGYAAAKLEQAAEGVPLGGGADPSSLDRRC